MDMSPIHLPCWLLLLPNSSEMMDFHYIENISSPHGVITSTIMCVCCIAKHCLATGPCVLPTFFSRCQSEFN